jgi:hypothetical protein
VVGILSFIYAHFTDAILVFVVPDGFLFKSAFMGIRGPTEVMRDTSAITLFVEA